MQFRALNLSRLDQGDSFQFLPLFDQALTHKRSEKAREGGEGGEGGGDVEGLPVAKSFALLSISQGKAGQSPPPLLAH